MFLDYIPSKRIPAAELFDGRLRKFGVRECGKRGLKSRGFGYLEDSRGYVRITLDDQGRVELISNYVTFCLQYVRRLISI